MKVGIDLSFIRADHNGGTEVVARNLLKGFGLIGKSKNIVIFISKELVGSIKKIMPEAEFVSYSLPGNHKVRTLLYQSLFLPRLARSKKLDLLFFPSYSSGLFNHFDMPVVVNPHDIQFKFYPSNFSLLKIKLMDLFYSNSFRKASGIVAISDYVKGTLEKFYGCLVKEKIAVLYNPVDFFEPEQFLSRNEIVKIVGNDPYILSVNTLAPHKNLMTLLKAYQLIAHEVNEKLVLVGLKKEASSAIEEYIVNNGLEGKVCLTGYVSESELRCLFCFARVFVTTSMYEGFGLSPVEALGAKVSTISTLETSLPEVTLGLAEYYEPAKNENVLAEKLLGLLGSDIDYASLEKASKVLREKYSLSVIAHSYWRYFEKIVGRKTV